MDITLELVPVVVAVTEAVKRTFPKPVSGAATILVAALIGGVFGYFKADILGGVFTGLAASGVLAGIDRVKK